MSFQVGDKVVCIWPGFGRTKGLQCTEMPVKGRVYVVRSVFVSAGTSSAGLLGVRLLGIYCNVSSVGWEAGWDARGFRKLEEMQQEARGRRSAGLQRGVGKLDELLTPTDVNTLLSVVRFPYRKVEGGAA
jgi:hypothetical protein